MILTGVVATEEFFIREYGLESILKDVFLSTKQL